MVYVLGLHCHQLMFSCSFYQFKILGLLYLTVIRLCRMNVARAELIGDWSPAAAGFLAAIQRSQVFS